MKRGKGLTRQQKECLFSHKINWNDWLFLQETDFFYLLVHKETGRTKRVDKFIIKPMGGIRYGRKKDTDRRSGKNKENFEYWQW